jgi:antitoxin (DNA-binding transcriptional repressor) of toxin-antitoxin stability system
MDRGRLVRAGERILITSHGDLIAELRSPELAPEAGNPPGLQELVRRGTIREAVRNDPSTYRSERRISVGTTARELLDWEGADR